MQQYNRKNSILIADDDLDDCYLVEEALCESGLNFNLSFVHDGIELLQYLNQSGSPTGSQPVQRPDLILLDLNMPRKDGREALAEVKADPNLRSIPVVVLTISNADEDILRTYDMGGAGFIVKPANVSEMVEILKVLSEYWFEVVELSDFERINRNLDN